MKPQLLSLPLAKKLKLLIQVGSPENIDTFIQDIICDFLAFKEHQDISSSKLSDDLSRLAYIRKIEEN